MTRVLIIDDSATARRRLGFLFGAASDFEVVAEAARGDEVLALLERHHPDVVCLDVFLEETDAAQVTRLIRGRFDTPIILVSDASHATPEVFEALAAGALELVPKPRAGDMEAVNRFLKTVRRIVQTPRAPRPPPREMPGPRPGNPPPRVVVLGASTGAPGPLRTLLAELPREFPCPIVVAQHLLAGFEADFARWLNGSTALEVMVAEDGALLTTGRVLLIPSGTDGRVCGGGARVGVSAAGPDGYHPSVDILFHSAAEQLGGSVIAVVLSGIGNEGVSGARAVVAAGGTVLVQEPSTCAVVGMPAAILKAGVPAVSGDPRALSRQLLRGTAR